MRMRVCLCVCIMYEYVAMHKREVCACTHVWGSVHMCKFSPITNVISEASAEDVCVYSMCVCTYARFSVSYY